MPTEPANHSFRERGPRGILASKMVPANALDQVLLMLTSTPREGSTREVLFEASRSEYVTHSVSADRLLINH